MQPLSENQLSLSNLWRFQGNYNSVVDMDCIRIRAGIVWKMLSLFGKLPLNVLYGIGGGVSWVMRNLLNYRKNVIYTNIARSFPDRTYEYVDSVAKQYYSRIGDLAAETIWFGGCTGKKGARRLREQRIYEYVNPEVLIEANRERGVMAMKSHCGNWELLGGIYEYSYSLDLHDYIDKDNFYVAYRAMSSKVSDIVFYENRRAPLPDYKGLVEDTKLMRHAVAHRKDKPIYVLNADQYPYKACHYVGKFLNQPTEGMLGGFSLASKLGFAVLYMREERVSRGHYRLTFEVISENAAGQDPERLMRIYYDLLEKDIRKDPVNWLWSHKRWHYDTLRTEAVEMSEKA